MLGCYRPGHFSTGPNQSFRSFAKGLCNEFDIRVVSSGRANAAPTEWGSDGICRSIQLNSGTICAEGLYALLREVPYDLLMLNGFFDREFTIPTLLLRRFGLVPRVPVILSPRGEFSEGALSLKSARKQVWLATARTLNLMNDCWFHATAPHERAAIEAAAISSKGILESPNVRELPDAPENIDTPPAVDKSLKVAFLGRISPVKNLHVALEILARVDVPVRYEVFGPCTDSEYLKRLEAQISSLPEHVTVVFRGPLVHDRVIGVLSEFDFFFMPTKGENFGHAISEALSAGLPVLISDQTPWRELEAHGAGWDLPLDDPERFVAAIESFVRAKPTTRSAMRRAARALSEKNFSESDAIVRNRSMLMSALGRRGYE